MKNFTFGLVMLLGGVALATNGCGGDDAADGAGGSAGSSAGKGGSSGSGGSSAGTSSTGGTGTAGTSSTGGTGTGGTGTAGTSAGGTGNSGDCPTAAPEDGAACAVEMGFGDACTYDDLTCLCSEQGGFPGGGGAGGDLEWNCFPTPGGFGGAPGGFGGAPGGDDACPTEQPENDSPCDGPIGAGFGNDPCSYGAVECVCPGGGPNEDTWQCE